MSVTGGVQICNKVFISMMSKSPRAVIHLARFPPKKIDDTKELHCHRFRT